MCPCDTTRGDTALEIMEDEVAKLSLAQDIEESQNNDIWALAIENLQPEDRDSLNFNYDKLSTLLQLKQEADEARKKCDERRLSYKRKNGQKVILRDVLGKLVKWISIFKEVGDTVMQYDPAHVALPWAAIRILLQVCTFLTC
jgi:hypothetical protein